MPAVMAAAFPSVDSSSSAARAARNQRRARLEAVRMESGIGIGTCSGEEISWAAPE